MVWVQIYFRNFNVAPLTLGGVAVNDGVAVQIDEQPTPCTWNNNHRFNYAAGTFTGNNRQPGAYQITQADDAGLVFTPNGSGSKVTYRP
jgi:hypothetical protein